MPLAGTGFVMIYFLGRDYSGGGGYLVEESALLLKVLIVFLSGMTFGLG